MGLQFPAINQGIAIGPDICTPEAGVRGTDAGIWRIDPETRRYHERHEAKMSCPKKRSFSLKASIGESTFRQLGASVD